MSSTARHENVSSDDVFVYYEHTDVSSIPKDITSLRVDKSVRKIPANAFFQQRRLKNVVYEEGLEVICDNAFFQCTALQEQKFPSTLVEIGKNAFGMCEKLGSVLLPLSLTIIKAGAFCYCYSLQSIVGIHDDIRMEESVFAGCISLKHFSLPRGMEIIPSNLFDGCESLMLVSVPSSVIEIGGRAFADCKKLSTILLKSGLKRIGSEAFASSGLKTFNCPATVESIDEDAFYHCDSLVSVVLPPKLEVISESTFQYCGKLKDINIPQSVVQIGYRAFKYSGLTQLDLSRCNIMSIEGEAFSSCRSLKDICLPRRGLKRIEERTFEFCEALTHLWVPPTVDHIDHRAFAGCSSLLSVEVPETLKSFVFVSLDDASEGEMWYQSLVNINLPPEQQSEVENDDFMESMKLGVAESDYDLLCHQLRWRFKTLPLHRACYFQSYRSLQFQDFHPIDCEKVDFLGMTPFHILALSRRPSFKLFQELLSVSSVDIMMCRDVFGSTPLDYLCKNHSPTATCMTISLLFVLMEPRVSFLGLDWWQEDVMSGLEEARLADAMSLGTKVTTVIKKLAKFERTEVLSLLEMSVWRMKMKVEMNASGSDSRENCRISCGSDTILENVIPFLRVEVL